MDDDEAEDGAEGAQKNREEGNESRNVSRNRIDGYDTERVVDRRSNQGGTKEEGNIDEAEQAALSEIVQVSPQKVKGSATMLKQMRNGEMHECVKCGSKYIQKKWYEAHVQKCTREGVNGRSVDVAVRLAHSMI